MSAVLSIILGEGLGSCTTHLVGNSNCSHEIAWGTILALSKKVYTRVKLSESLLGEFSAPKKRVFLYQRANL